MRVVTSETVSFICDLERQGPEVLLVSSGEETALRRISRAARRSCACHDVPQSELYNVGPDIESVE